MKVKSLPKEAEYQKTLTDGSKVYASFRKAYIVTETENGQIIESIRINR